MENYIGEIRLFAFASPPAGWLPCDGTLLSISGNAYLYDMIGTAYGGDGVTEFAVPDYRGRLAMGSEPSNPIGQKGGATGTVLNSVPQHSHTVNVMNADGSKPAPGGEMLAAHIDDTADSFYAAQSDTTLAAETVGQAGLSTPQPVSNMQPFLAMCYGISTTTAESEPFIGEIRLLAGDKCPDNWAFCDGSLLSKGTHPVLFSILGTTFGSSGSDKFALPDLRGRAALGFGTGPGLPRYALGQAGGKETTIVTSDCIPGHTHALNAGTATGIDPAEGNYLAATSGSSPVYLYADKATNPPLVVLDNHAIASTGQGTALSTMQPYLAVNYIISLMGLYPSRS